MGPLRAANLSSISKTVPNPFLRELLHQKLAESKKLRGQGLHVCGDS